MRPLSAFHSHSLPGRAPQAPLRSYSQLSPDVACAVSECESSSYAYVVDGTRETAAIMSLNGACHSFLLSIVASETDTAAVGLLYATVLYVPPEAVRAIVQSIPPSGSYLGSLNGTVVDLLSPEAVSATDPPPSPESSCRIQYEVTEYVVYTPPGGGGGTMQGALRLSPGTMCEAVDPCYSEGFEYSTDASGNLVMVPATTLPACRVRSCVLCGHSAALLLCHIFPPLIRFFPLRRDSLLL